MTGRRGRAGGVRTWTAIAATVTLTGSLLSVVAPAASAAVPAPTSAAAVAAVQVTQRPDLPSAVMAARAAGHRVQVTGRDTESTTTYVNPDGTLTSESSALPVRVRTATGLVAVDATLVHRPDGSVGPRAATAGQSLGNGGSGRLASLTVGPGSSLGLSWLSSLPTPTLAGDTATYANVLPGADLLVRSADMGFEVSLVLKSRPAAPLGTLRLPLSGTGLTAAVDPTSGSLRFTDTAGRPVAQGSAPVMWDATVDPRAGEHTHRAPVAMSVTGAAGAQVLSLIPDSAFLTDPATTYPVTVDPGTSLARTNWTYVDKAYPTTTYWNSTDIARVGTYNGGAQVDRSIFQFDSTAVAHKHVLSASLNLYENLAYSCTATQFDIYAMAAGATSSSSWNNQPAVGSKFASASFAHGAGSACPAQAVGVPVTTLAQAFANAGTAGTQLELRASNEADSYSWKKFNNNPSMSVTYNSYPATPTSPQTSPAATCTYGAGRPYLNTTTPTLKANVSDPDGGTLKGAFELWHTGGAQIGAQNYSASVSSGAQAGWAVPAGNLVNGATYSWRTRGYDGTDYSSYPPFCEFTVDTTAPNAPVVSSSTWPERSWSTPTTGTLNWSDASTDVASYSYWLDTATSRTTVPASTTSVAYSTALVAGEHTLHVQAKDRAGNLSQYDYNFGIGSGALTSPADEDRTQQSVTLQATGPQPYVAYQYTVGLPASAASWKPVPTADVTPPGSGTAIAGWPVALSAYPTGLNWNAYQSVHADGLVDVRACFYATTTDTTPTCSTPSDLHLTRHAFGDSYATSTVGPASVSLLTGDSSVEATDVTVPSYSGTLTLTRSATSLTPPPTATGATGVFGPGWTASLPGPDAGASDQSVAENRAAGYVLLTDASGGESLYATTAKTASSITYTGQGDVKDGSTLVETADSTGRFTTLALTDPDGTVTTWTTADNGVSWALQSVHEPAGDTSSYDYDAAGRVAHLVGPAPAGVSCSSAPLSTAGCRTLTMTYAAGTSTTLSATTWGDYTGRLTGVSLTTADPTAGDAMRTVELSHYAYDNTGLLRAQWDPRLSPALKTTYSYDTAPANNAPRLTSVTPDGVPTAWKLAYDSRGRLTTAAHNDPTAGKDAVSAVVYDLPLSGTSGLPDLSAAAAAAWGQNSDLPAPNAAAAVFPPDHTPAGTTPATVTAADWPYASLTYLDVNGRAVDTAAYGAGSWQLAATRYDQQGQPVVTLDPAGRAEALDTGNTSGAGYDPAVAALVPGSPSCATAVACSAQRAQLLQTVMTYSSDGTELLDTRGPARQVTLDDGTQADAYPDTTVTYDQGAPNNNQSQGMPYRLPTTSTGTAQLISDNTKHDPRTTTTGYDPVVVADPSGWDLRAATSTTTVLPGKPSITHLTRYNSRGQVTETRMPSDPDGTGAGTTLTSYYTATGTGRCAKASEAGLTCQESHPAAATPELPTTSTDYDLYSRPLTVTETVGATSRTATTDYGYNTADPLSPLAYRASLTVSPAGALGTDRPDVYTCYDTTTGRPTDAQTVPCGQSGGQQVHTGYDTLDRPTSYTDVTGNTATSSYDIDGRTTQTNDGKASRSYTYDSASEHRGMVTAFTDTQAGTFTAGYDAGGALTQQQYPNGLTATYTHDEAGHDTNLAYSLAGSTGWPSFTADYSPNGQIRQQSSNASTQQYTYDNAGRLTQTNDTPTATSACQVRKYGFNDPTNTTSTAIAGDRPGLNSDRLTQASYDDPTGACQSATATISATHSYDPADRITDPGYAYDAFGRTTTTPAAASTTNQDSTLSYYANDMVASQTTGTGATATSKAWTLDLTGRLLAETTTGDPAPANNTTATNHYSGGGDSPAWISTSDGAWTRNVAGLAGDLAAIVTTDPTGANSTALQLVNLHGDVVATTDNTSAATSTTAQYEYTEYGAPRPDSTTPTRYGWLGGKQRSSDTLGGLTLMGIRLYNPSSGRFLSVDPVAGGSANDYDYVYQDPINKLDLGGTCWGGGDYCHPRSWHKHWRGIAQFGLAAGCVVASAGACLFASVVVAVAVNVHHRRRSGWSFNRTGFAIDAGLAFGGGFFARWASGSWRSGAFQRFGRHERFRRFARHARRQRISWRSSASNMGLNSSIGGAGAAAAIGLHHHHYGDD